MARQVLKRFCCWNLEQATRGAPIFQLLAGIIALFLVLLDLVAFGVDGFEISGGFKSYWRVLIWKQWLACNIVMVCAHIVMIVVSIFLIYTIRPSNVIYKRIHMLRVWFWLMICYTLIAVAIGTYQFSWYGKNSFRRPFLCFTLFFFAIRMIANILGILVVSSRVQEIRSIVKAPAPETKGLYEGWPSEQTGLDNDAYYDSSKV